MQLFGECSRQAEHELGKYGVQKLARQEGDEWVMRQLMEKYPGVLVAFALL